MWVQQSPFDLQPPTSDQFLLHSTSSPLISPKITRPLPDDRRHLVIMGFHGSTSKSAARHAAWCTVDPSRALSYHKIPHVLWGDFLWIVAFRVPTACLDTIYFVVPNDRVDAAVKGISAYLPYYQRSPTTQLVLPNGNYPVDFPDIPVLEYPPFRIGIIPENLVAFDPTDTARITTIEYLYPRANAARAARLVRRCIAYSLTAATETPQHIRVALRTYDGGCPARV